MIDLRFWIKKPQPPRIDETIDFKKIFFVIDEKSKLGPKKLFMLQELIDKKKPTSERYKNVLVVIPAGYGIREVILIKE